MMTQRCHSLNVWIVRFDGDDDDDDDNDDNDDDDNDQECVNGAMSNKMSRFIKDFDDTDDYNDDY